MTSNACPLPSPTSDDEAAAIARMLQANVIAVVGLSDDPSRTSHPIAAQLQAAGKRIIPVNPNCKMVFGEVCHPSLSAIGEPVDLVNVFRRSDACAQVTADAIAIGAKGVWLQSGIVNEKARKLAAESGIDFVQNRCIGVEMGRL